MSALRAGSGQADITPPIGKAMGGYQARQGVAQGTHDPLGARAVAFEQNDRRIGLVSCDLLGLDRDIVRRIERAAAPLGLQRVLVACTHTHSGPAGLAPPFDDEVVKLVEAGIHRALEMAVAKLSEARLGHGVARAPQVGLNRRNPDEPVDSAVSVLRVDGLEGQPIAGILHFACHPTVLGAENLLYSADYPGAACKTLREAAGGGVMLFLNGAAGDVSTRFTRRDASFAEADRLGELLGRAATRAWGNAQPHPDAPLESATAEVRVPARALPTLEEAQAEQARAELALETARARGLTGGELRQFETARQGADRGVAMVNQGVTVQPLELIALRLGEVCLVSNPGELFNAFASRLQARFDAPVLLVGYANGRAGYLPTLEAFDHGGYEVSSSPYAQRAGELVLDASAALVGRLRPGRAR